MEPVKWVIIRHGAEEHDVDVVGPFDRRDDAERYAADAYGPDAATVGWFVAPLLAPVYDEAPAGAPELEPMPDWLYWSGCGGRN